MARPRKNPVPPADGGIMAESDDGTFAVAYTEQKFTKDDTATAPKAYPPTSETRKASESFTIPQSVADEIERRVAGPSDPAVPSDDEDKGPVPLGPMSMAEAEALRVERKDVREITPRSPTVRSTEFRPTLRGADMLSDEQRAMLLKDGIKRILDRPTDIRIPSMVRYTDGPDGIMACYAFFDIDARLMEEAYDYYRDNADDPSPKGMIDLISEVVGRPQRIIPRCAFLNWSGTPTRR